MILTTEGMRALVQRYHDEWALERAKLDASVLDAARTKRMMPSNYWLAEFEARLRLRAAQAMLEAVSEFDK